MTQFADMLSHLGGMPVMAGLPFGVNAKYYFVDPVNGSDGNDGLSIDSAVATLPVAYAKCTANQHDTVFYIAGSTGLTLAAVMVWAKNYTHLIGICAPTNVAQRARIHNETVTGLTPLLTISATGCIFKNFYIFQGVDEAVANMNVKVTGGRNYFENVHFAGGGHASQAINGGGSLLLDTTACEENLFVNCTIGVDTIDAATGMTALRLDGGNHRNMFKDCVFRMRAGHTGAAFVEVVDATGIDRDTTFWNCLFINNATGFDMASAFLIPAMGEPRLILLKDCLFHNVTKLDASDRGVLFGNMDAVTGADLSGVAAQLIT
jgi:hypothetical protein